MSLLISIILLLFSTNVLAETYDAATCEYGAVNTAIGLASNGDTVSVPAGSCEWTTTNTVTLSAGIIMQGAGIDSTTITVDGADNQGVVHMAATSTLKGFTFTQKDASKPNAVFITTGDEGARVTGNKFTGTTGYAVYVSEIYEVLIDTNQFLFTDGSDQPVNIWGPSDSWTTANTIGEADNVFFEDNTFLSGNRGYVVCANNARCVFRYNTATSPASKVFDVHGSRTPSGSNGARHYEIYHNTFTGSTGYPRLIEIRGGSGRIFDNTLTVTSENPALIYDEQCARNTDCDGLGGLYACPSDVPIVGQIGTGVNPTGRGDEPLYSWGNVEDGGYWTADTVALPVLAVTQCGVAHTIADIIAEGTDYFDSETKPAAMDSYTPYTYPHPLNTDALPTLYVDEAGNPLLGAN